MRRPYREYFNELQLKCGQYGIKYVRADINEGFNKILTTYLVERSEVRIDSIASLLVFWNHFVPGIAALLVFSCGRINEFALHTMSIVFLLASSDFGLKSIYKKLLATTKNRLIFALAEKQYLQCLAVARVLLRARLLVW